jgi:hypothetical protein
MSGGIICKDIALFHSSPSAAIARSLEGPVRTRSRFQMLEPDAARTDILNRMASKRITDSGG